MKRFLIIPICLFLPFCSSHPEPKDVAQQFLTSFDNYQFEQAKALSTPELQKALDYAARKMKVKKNPKKGDYSYKEEVTQGDLSTIEFVNKEKKTLTVKLNKREGKWLVANIEQ